MNEKDELELIIKLTAQGMGQADIIKQLEQIERAAKTASAAVQAAATQPTLTTNKGQYTSMFTANALNPGVKLTAQAVPPFGQQTLPGFGTSGNGPMAKDYTEQAAGNKEVAYSLDDLNKALAENVQMTDEQAAAMAAQKKALQEEGDLYRNSAQEIEALSQSQARSAKEEIQYQRERTAALKPYNQALSESLRQVNEMRKVQFAGRALTEVSQTFFIPSAAILTGASLWASNYAKNATTATDTTVRWKAAMDSLTVSQNKVGATLADIGLPILEKLATLAEDAANFASANPQIVKAGLAIAATVAGISGLGMLAAKGIRMYADVQFMVATNNLMISQNNLTLATDALDANVAMLNKTMMGEVIERAGVPAAGAGTVTFSSLIASAMPVILTIGSVVGGVLAGNAGYNAIKDKNAPDAWTTEKQALTLTGGQIMGTFVGLFEALGKGTPVVETMKNDIAEFTIEIGQLLGVINQPAAKVDMEAFAEQNLKEWTDYQKQLADAQKSYDKQLLSENESYQKNRLKTEQDYNKSVADAQAKYQADVAKSYQSYQESESNTITNYYADRTKQAAQHSQEMLQMEQDHEIKMARLLEDHNDVQKDNLEKLDGLAMIREDEKYEKERKRDEEDYNLDVSRKDAQYGETLRDNEAQFARERQQRAAAFKQSLVDAANNYKAEQAQAKATEEQKLKDLDEAHADQLAALKSAYDDQLDVLDKTFKDRLRTISANILGDQAAVENASAVSHAAFVKWLKDNSYNAPDKGAGQASGGYVGFGQYTVGEEGKEFILNNRSTRLAEQSIGGRLTQDNLLASLFGGKGNYSDQRTLQFNGMTEADRAAIRRDIYAVTKEVFAEAMG
jgi:G:T/U-mismatch repair DNA glycosylase